MAFNFNSSFSNDTICRALDFYNFQRDEDARNILLSFRYLLQYRDKTKWKCPSKNQIIDAIRSFGRKKYVENKLEDVHEVLDILLTYSPSHAKEFRKLLDNPLVLKTQGPVGTIYADNQSVHNTDLNESVKNASLALCERYKPIYANLDNYRLQVTEKIRGWIGDVSWTSKIFQDVAVFCNGKITLEKVLFSLVMWIEEQDTTSSDILKRFKTEMVEGYIYCATGRLARMINVMQGYTLDSSLQTKISDKEQAKTVVYTFLDKMLQLCDDEILDGLMDGSEPFRKHITSICDDKMDSWQKEYGKDFIEHAKNAVNIYTKLKIYEV